jgi:hypothetical protein
VKLLREPELVPFVFDGHDVRTVTINGEPLVNIGEDVRKVFTLAASSTK